MLPDSEAQDKRRQVTERLSQASRELREQEQALARLKYEWNIAKRLRNQARHEEEREKWQVQSDAYMGMILQQETAIEETQASIADYRAQLAELDESTSS